MGKILFRTTWVLFSSLGAYRGKKCYDFKFNQRVKSFEKDLGLDYQETLKRLPLMANNWFICKIIPRYCPELMCWVGFVLYGSPFSGPFMLCNELRILVINLLGCNNVKEEEAYYKKYYKFLYNICSE